MADPIPRIDVPCNGCRLCCQENLVVLDPAHGDDSASYDTVDVIAGTGVAAKALRKKDNGDCIYLGDSGCTIHERKPVMCRVFDCRRMYLKHSNHRARIDAILEAGRQRVGSLPAWSKTGEANATNRGGASRSPAPVRSQADDPGD